MSAFIRDVAFALRLVRRTPLISAAVVLTFALGIGANVAIFSVAWPALPEVKQVIRAVRMESARAAARKALAAPDANAVVKALVDGIGDSVDLAAFTGRWSLSPGR